jgi:hypothetical protein
LVVSVPGTGSAPDGGSGGATSANTCVFETNNKITVMMKAVIFLVVIRPLMFLTKRLTVCVTRWWAGRGNAILTETTSSRANCLKTRRLPPVGCTLCWAVLFSQLPISEIKTQGRFVILIVQLLIHHSPCEIIIMPTNMNMNAISTKQMVIAIANMIESITLVRNCFRILEYTIHITSASIARVITASTNKLWLVMPNMDGMPEIRNISRLGNTSATNSMTLPIDDASFGNDVLMAK